MHIAIRSSWYLLMQLVTSVYAKIIFYPKYRYLKVLSKESLSVHNHREIIIACQTHCYIESSITLAAKVAWYFKRVRKALCE